MCYYSDLFGDVIVTLDDVNLWLDSIPDMCGANQTRRNYYAENHDLANKIKLSKLNGSFDLLINDREMAINEQKLNIDIFKTIYKKDLTELINLICPDYFHVCTNPKCAVYIKRLAHDKHAAAYAKRKNYKRTS